MYKKQLQVFFYPAEKTSLPVLAFAAIILINVEVFIDAQVINILHHYFRIFYELIFVVVQGIRTVGHNFTKNVFKQDFGLAGFLHLLRFPPVYDLKDIPRFRITTKYIIPNSRPPRCPACEIGLDPPEDIREYSSNPP
jgi:hypothetical protein